MKKYIQFFATSIIGLALFAFVGSTAHAQTFTNNLTLGSSGTEVTSLQTWLESKGFLVMPAGTIKGYFGGLTKAALIKYQISAGIIPPSGYFGPITRAKILGTNSGGLTINGIDAPTTLTTGQVGTWKVRASDPANGVLSYNVSWGDETGFDAQGVVILPHPFVFVQTSVFTHSYSRPGTYTVTFMVKNSKDLIVQTSATVVVTDQSSTGPLKVISPNGGENWKKGTTQNITWTAPQTYTDIKKRPVECPAGYSCQAVKEGTPRPVPMQHGDIFITAVQTCLPPAPCAIPVRYKIATNINIDNLSFPWVVGSHEPILGIQADSDSNIIRDGSYIIQICDTSTNSCDSSDKPFTISSPTTEASVTVTSPNGGEAWDINSHRQIAWNFKSAVSDSKVDIFLTTVYTCPSVPEGVSIVCIPNQVITLDKNIPVETIYTWIVGTDIINNPIPAGTYKMKVCIAGTDKCDLSDKEFTLRTLTY